MNESRSLIQRLSVALDSKSVEYSTVTIALICLCLPLIYFISKGVVYPGHDYWVHIQWGTVFAEQLWSGDYYPRWLADIDGGAGSPAMFYYPPLSHFITAPFSLLFPERELFYWRMNLASMLLIFVSFVSARFFLRSAIKNKDSTIPSCGALLYVAHPYFYVADVYVRGAFAEAWVFAWVPIVFFGLNIIERQRARGMSCIVLGVFGIVSTHIVSAVFWLPVACFYLLIVKPSKQNFVVACLSIVLGIGLSSAYLFTALAYIELANISWMYSLDKIYSSFVVNLQTINLLATGELKFTSMIFIFVAFTLVGMFVFLVLTRKFDRVLVFWLAVFVVSFFMMTPLSAALWRLVPIIYKIQFSWRLTAVLSFVFVVLYASVFDKSSGHARKVVLYIFPFVLCFILPLFVYFAGLSHISNGKAIDSYEGISENSYKLYLGGKRPSFNAYEHQLVPIDVLDKYRYLEFIEIDDETVSYKLIENKPRFLALTVDASKATTIRFKRQAFYGTEIKLNKHILEESFDKRMIVLDLRQGENIIEISLKRMPAETAGYWVSLVSLIFFIFLLLATKYGWPPKAFLWRKSQPALIV